MAGTESFVKECVRIAEQLIRREKGKKPRPRSQYTMLIEPNKKAPAEKKHTCTPRCSMEKFSVITYSVEGNVHVCVEGICSKDSAASRHEKMIGTPITLYVCEKTLSAHACGDLCTSAMEMKRKGNSIPDSGYKCPITGQMVSKKEHRVLSSKEKRECMEYAVNAWRDKISIGLYFPADESSHSCNTDYVSIPGELREDGEERDDASPELTREEFNFKGKRPDARKFRKLSQALRESNGCVLERIRGTVFASSSDDSLHTCLEKYCEHPGDSQHHASVLFKMEDLYICQSTGIPHYCGEWCTRKVATKDGMYVCQLTGDVSSAPVMRDPMFSYDSRLKMDSDARRPHPQFETPVLSMEDISLASADEPLVERTAMDVKKRGNKKETYMMEAVSKIAGVFSKAQMEAEEQVMDDSMQKEITSQLNRYFNQRYQNRELLSASEMYLLLLSHHKKKDFKVRFTLGEEHRKNLALFYAKKCLQLWYIIRTRTATGRESPQSFLFKDFVIPALLLLQSGFKVSEGDLGYEVTIIEEDYMLRARGLDNAARLSNRMQSSPELVAEWTHGKKKSVTDRVRYTIEAAMLRAIRDEGVSPESLRIDSIDFDAINVDDLSPTLKRSR